jgi:hypothetical protein
VALAADMPADVGALRNLAADVARAKRGYRACRYSEVTKASSGHHKAAATTAGTYAARMDRDVASHDPESLSVFGSLLLRGAIAAARHDDRRTAHDLLGEADDAGSRVGEPAPSTSAALPGT